MGDFYFSFTIRYKWISSEMSKKLFIKLVRKYLSGKADKEEKEFLESYYTKFEEERSPELSLNEREGLRDELFLKINSRIDQENRGGKVKELFRVYRIAAVIVVGLGLGWLTYTIIDKEVGQVAEQFTEVVVPLGKIRNLTLEDGTKVTLNAGSKFRYPTRFGDDSVRQVYLDGEGFFKVTHRADQPFIVKSGKLDVRVLGTSFNVRSYQEDVAMEVAVVTGKVAVQTTRESSKDRVLLLPQEKVSYRVANGLLQKETSDSSDVFAWQKGLLHFRNRPLKEIVRVIERRYAVSIEINKPMEDCLVYATIGEEPAEQTLKAFSRLLNAKLSSKDGKYQFIGKRCQN